MLWSPLAFGAGCAVYLALRSEPPLWLAVLLALAGVVAAILIQRSRAPLVWVVAVSLLAFVPAGFMAAKVRAMRVAAPVLTETRPYFIQGWVVDLALSLIHI